MSSCIYSNSYVHLEEIVDIFGEMITIINDLDLPVEQQKKAKTSKKNITHIL